MRQPVRGCAPPSRSREPGPDSPREAYSLDARHAGKAQQTVRKREIIVTVRADEDACNHYLPITLSSAALGLSDDLVKRARDHELPGIRDRTERAEYVAAILDLDGS